MVFDINVKKLKASYVSGIIWIIIGVITFIFIAVNSLPTFIKKGSLDSEVEASSVEWKIKEMPVIDLEFYSADYTFSVNEKEYICQSKYYGDMKDADSLLYYNSNNPSACLTSFDIEISTIIACILAVPLTCIIAGIFILLKRMKKNHLITHLAKYGTLIKRVPYQIYTTNRKVDGEVIKYFVVKYTFENRVTKLFKSDFFVNSNCDNYGLCDLLVDEKNLDNFIIDFEIRTTGKGEPKVIVYEQVYSDYRKINY